MMKAEFMSWAGKRIRRRFFCRMERSMKCIPLDGDEICLDCYRLITGKDLQAKDPLRKKRWTNGQKSHGLKGPR
jgi:hypothetical protein